jgi:hypothetical protein
MSTTYRAIAWNPQERHYDLVAGGLIASFLAVVLGVQVLSRPELMIETLLIRSLGAASFGLLSVILCIGPLARLDRCFLPLLYNRRHLGVMMFTLALAHGAFSIVQFHSAGTLDPLVSVLVGTPGTTQSVNCRFSRSASRRCSSSSSWRPPATTSGCTT